MTMMNDIDFIGLMKVAAGGVYASFGGLTNYVYQKTKNPNIKFSWFLMFAHMLISFFVGQVAFSLIPDEYWWKSGLVAIFGYLAYPILDYTEKNGVNIIVATLKRVFNIKKD